MRRLSSKTKDQTLFNCGVGVSQVAITPQGELKPCLMMDSPRYKIRPGSLNTAWKRLKKAISKIKPDNKYLCGGCSLRVYCKWCPAQSWLYNKTYTSCVPEFRQSARQLKPKAALTPRQGKRKVIRS